MVRRLLAPSNHHNADAAVSVAGPFLGGIQSGGASHGGVQRRADRAVVVDAFLDPNLYRRSGPSVIPYRCRCHCFVSTVIADLVAGDLYLHRLTCGLDRGIIGIMDIGADLAAGGRHCADLGMPF